MSDGVAELFRCLTAGVYVIGVSDGERVNGFTAAWVTQVSFDPLLLALSVNPEHASYPLLMRGGVFAVNVLGAGQLEVARRFGTRSGRETDKLAGVSWRRGAAGSPILNDAIAFLECRLIRSVPAGDHELILGQVLGGEIQRPGAAPMTYAETGNLDGSAELYPASL